MVLCYMKNECMKGNHRKSSTEWGEFHNNSCIKQLLNMPITVWSTNCTKYGKWKASLEWVLGFEYPIRVCWIQLTVLSLKWFYRSDLMHSQIWLETRILIIDCFVCWLFIVRVQIRIDFQFSKKITRRMKNHLIGAIVTCFSGREFLFNIRINLNVDFNHYYLYTFCWLMAHDSWIGQT